MIVKLADQGVLKIPFFRLGKWRHPKYGPIEGTQAKFDSIVKNFKQNVPGRPPYIRLGHSKDDSPTFGDTPSEAWVKDIVQEGSVLYALAAPTNQEIVEAVKTKKYRFASPEYEENYISKESGQNVGPTLTAIGLTNEPFLTQLPDAVVLADPQDTIYLDYEEVKEPMENETLKKLAEAFTRFLDNFKSAPAAGGLTDAERQKLAEIDTVKTKLAEMDGLKAELAQTKTKLSEAEKTTWQTQVESRLNSLIQKGIPPAMCEPVKTILLANPAAATTMVKLADNKEISLAEQLYASLEALPEEHRIKMPQVGKQEMHKPGSPEEIKKMADEDVKAMGGKVTDDGKYIL